MSEAPKGVTVMTSVDATGAFVRKPSTFRDAVSSEPGALFPPAAGRYIVYISLACPWANRTLAYLEIKGLRSVIDVAVVHPVWTRTKPEVDDHEGWTFDPTFDAATTPDPVFGARTLREVYERACELHGYEVPARFTTPLFLDKEAKRIVNNESLEIIRFLNTEFNAFATSPSVDLRPHALAAAIDASYQSIYEWLCDGVYKCGFAQSQGAYDTAVTNLFATLTRLDALLAKQRFLVAGASLTEVDICVFMTLVRFDDVYAVHFKCGRKLLREHTHLFGYMLDVCQTAHLQSVVNMAHIKHHYYRCHTSLNRYGIIPATAVLDLDAPHGRAALPLSPSA